MRPVDYVRLHRNATGDVIRYLNGMTWKDLEIDPSPMARRARRMISEVRSEIHRLRGFIRLKSLGDVVLYSDVKTEHNTLGILARFFARRFPSTVIILGNNTVVSVALYNRGLCEDMEINRSIREVLDEIQPMLNGEEVNITRIWETYYASQYAPERINLKLFHRNMPRKYLKNARLDVETRYGSMTLDDFM